MNRSAPSQSALPHLKAGAKIGLLTLRVNPLRTALSTLGVVMGVASVVSVLSVGDGVAAFARDQVARTTDLQLIAVTPRTTQQLDGVLVPRTDVAIFTPDDVASISRAAPEADVVSLSRTGGSFVQRDSGSARRGITVTALAATARRVASDITAGRALTDAELASDRRVTVLSASAADSLAGARSGASLVGGTILMRGIPFSVIGVLAPQKRERVEATIPWRAAQPLGVTGNGDLPPMMTVVAGTIDSVASMLSHVRTWAATRYGRTWNTRIDVQANTARVEQFAQAMLVFKLLMGAITGISLLVGGIGIMNVLLAAVAERTREIGIRKAVGARRRDVVVQFLSESLAITSVGGAVGLAFGFVVALVTAAIMRARTGAAVSAEFGLSTMLVAVGASVTVGITFGLYPALRASRLSPVDAIRHE